MSISEVEEELQKPKQQGSVAGSGGGHAALWALAGEASTVDTRGAVLG